MGFLRSLLDIDQCFTPIKDLDRVLSLSSAQNSSTCPAKAAGRKSSTPPPIPSGAKPGDTFKGPDGQTWVVQ